MFIHVWAGGLEVFGGIRGWFSSRCSSDKIWKHHISRNHEPESRTSPVYDFRSYDRCCYPLDQTKPYRLREPSREIMYTDFVSVLNTWIIFSVGCVFALVLNVWRSITEPLSFVFGSGIYIISIGDIYLRDVLKLTFAYQQNCNQ